MRPTKTDETMAALESAYEGDEERVELIRRARRFKSSWVELAEALTAARKSGSWKRWGHASFEAYAKDELHLRQETVEKLTGSYAFLAKRAPEALRRDGLGERIPDYRAVDYLRRAEESESAPEEVVRDVWERVVVDGAGAAAVARKFDPVVFPIDEATKKTRDAAGIRNVASRLRELLAESHAVPRKLAASVTAELDRLLEALPARDERAA